MIAGRLVLHHNYSRGVAFDLSENGNHGQLIDVVPAGGPATGTLHFSGGASEVHVNPSPSLSNLRSVRAQVRFQYDPDVPGDHRHNLVEGHLAFALFIHPDGSLLGTILNQLGNWEGTQSPAGVINPGEWHVAEFVHDGISHSSLYLDGHLVGEGFTSPGPVRSVGPNGVAIGHWPEPSGQYTLEGNIAEVRVWCDDPVADAGRLIDDCCIDRAEIDRRDEQVRRDGLDAPALQARALGLLDTLRQAASYLTSGSAANRDQALDLGRRTLLSLETGDYATLVDTIFDGVAIMQSRASNADLAPLWANVQSFFGDLTPVRDAGVSVDGLTVEQIVDWLAPWCIDEKARPPRRPERGERPPPTTDHSRDPDTDRADPPTYDGDAVTGGGGTGHEPVGDPPPPVPPEPLDGGNGNGDGNGNGNGDGDGGVG